jgi:hypothetical protein
MTIDTILNLYNEGVRNIILYGPPGTGKTYTITGPNMLLSRLAKETITATTEHGFNDILPLRYDYMNQKPSEAEEAAEEEAEEETPSDAKMPNFEKMKGKELKQWCKAFGLSSSGKISELKERLKEKGAPDFEKMKNAELKECCTAFGLTKSGVKSVLIDRLKENVFDASKGAAEEEVKADICCQDSDESFHSKSGVPWKFEKWKDGDGKDFEWQSKIHYEILQFHASYDYSDFMMGVAFDENGSLTNEFKILYRFAMCATLNPGRLHVLHIDEINRGNVARIFGEALMAMEKRNFPVTLRDGTWFTMPNNLLILGTMNSADHHIQPMDQALRRRFCFVPLLPMNANDADWISPGILVDDSPAKQLYSRVLEVFKRPGEESIWDTNRNGLDLREFAIGPSFFKLDKGDEDTWQNVKDQNWTKKVENQLSEYEKEGIVSLGTADMIKKWLDKKIKSSE